MKRISLISGLLGLAVFGALTDAQVSARRHDGQEMNLRERITMLEKRIQELESAQAELRFQQESPFLFWSKREFNGAPVFVVPCDTTSIWVSRESVAVP